MSAKAVRLTWLAEIKAYPNLRADGDGYANLCSFCKYEEGGEEQECHHPVERVQDLFEDHYPMFTETDCWGFQPRMKLAAARDWWGALHRDQAEREWEDDHDGDSEGFDAVWASRTG